MDELQRTRIAYDRRTIQSTVIATLADLVQDWDIEDPIEGSTRVVADLGFESIDLIQMVAALERAFKLKGGSLVEMLVEGGRYVDDLTVDRIVERVDERIAERDTIMGDKRQA